MSESHTVARERVIEARTGRGKDGLRSEGRQVLRRRGRASTESLL